jgi:hypothetical protein
MKALAEKHPMVTWGMYGSQLKKYLEYFPLEKIHIIKFEDIKTKPKEVIQGVYRFLGVDSSFVPAYLDKHWTPATNLPGNIRPWKKRIFYTSSLAVFARRLLRKLGFKNIQVYRKFSPPVLDRDLKRKLTKYYDDEIKLLMQLSKVDFSNWLSSSI